MPMFTKLISKFSTDLKLLFLIDALGALLTAISLGGILAQLESYFGMPQEVLYTLAIIATFYAIYSFSIWRLPQIKKVYLQFIAFGNLAYLLLTFGLVVSHQYQLTPLGMMYFSFEMLIILMVIIVEFTVITQQKHRV